MAVMSWAGANGFSRRDAAGDALRGPLIRRGAGHVDDRKCWVRLPHPSGDIPTAQPSHQTNVRDERLVFLGATHEQSRASSAEDRISVSKPDSASASSRMPLQLVLVFDDEN